MEKKSSRRLARVNALAEKLRFLPHLSEDERVLYAWSFAATPDERWQRSRDLLRSLLSAQPRALQRMIRRKEASCRAVDLAMLPLLRDIAASRKRLRIRR
ncbi:MAG: hypothetical protein ABMA01_12470 [Chthoniobacteraceae bacterium]